MSLRLVQQGLMAQAAVLLQQASLLGWAFLLLQITAMALRTALLQRALTLLITLLPLQQQAKQVQGAGRCARSQVQQHLMHTCLRRQGQTSIPHVMCPQRPLLLPTRRCTREWLRPCWTLQQSLQQLPGQWVARWLA